MARRAETGARVPEVRRLLDRTISRFEPLAPDWFVRVVAPKQAPVPWANMVRFALSITTPLLAGLLIGQPALGTFGGMGALLGAFGDAGGPFRRRLRRTGLGLIAGLVGLLVGRVLHEQGWAGVLVVGVFGVVSALISSINAEFSFAGLQLLVYLALAGGPARAAPLAPLLVAFLIGAAWAVLLSFVQTVLKPEPDRPQLAVAAVLGELAALLRTAENDPEALRGDALRQARRRLTVAIGRAYDAVAEARATSSGTRNDLRHLAGVLAAVTELAAVAVAEVGRHPAEVAAVAPDVESLQQRITSRRRLGAPPMRAATDTPAGSALARARAQLGRAGDESAARLVGVARRPVGVVLAELLAGRTVWLFAARLALSLMAAQALTVLLPLPRPYWLLLTTAVVLKPDFGSIFARGVQRALGTLAGVLMGAVVLALVPPGPLLLLPLAVFAFLFPLGASRNFGMLSTFLTPLTLLLVEFAGGGGAGLATSRLLDTVLGAAVVLLVGYLPWPSTWRPDLAAQVAGAVDALAAYAEALGGPAPEVVPLRRHMDAALADVRADLQGALAEPTPRAREASAWFPLVAQLDHVAEDLRDASILGSRGVGGGPPDARAGVAGALRELATAIREHRSPRAVDLPESGMLATVADDLRAAWTLVAGPDRADRRPASG